MYQATELVCEGFGGPDTLRPRLRQLEKPRSGEVLVRQTAIGVNFIDTMQRRGLVPGLDTPFVPGFESAGIIEATGPDVQGLEPGQRVAVFRMRPGAYADRVLVPHDRVVVLPPQIDDRQSASLLFKGLTAQYLLRRTTQIGPGSRIVIHAAAGGVGQILARWARSLGAEVFGTAGSAAKVDSALKAGCMACVDYSQPGWEDELASLLGPEKADVVYDSVGAATFMKSLNLVRRFGLVVVFGGASGPAPAVTPEELNRHGCLFLTRPSVFPHNDTAQTLRRNAEDLFEAVAAGTIFADVGLELPLSDAATAHAELEARRTAGSIVLKA